ncbi:hypothetical protein RF11_05728 [Thelohanellus kitauei]|uniref:Uncharacterized protein n=1 Tax=Thelohanellus kitauei TaxID=669202 RepID=A0A0C2M7E8_THEKT|nr:hypothetical protein RF11_05728 [Thelohanellus kitauei]
MAPVNGTTDGTATGLPRPGVGLFGVWIHVPRPLLLASNRPAPRCRLALRHRRARANLVVVTDPRLIEFGAENQIVLEKTTEILIASNGTMTMGLLILLFV